MSEQIRWLPPVAITANQQLREELRICAQYAGCEFDYTDSIPEGRRRIRRRPLVVIGFDLAARIRKPIWSTGLVAVATLDRNDTRAFSHAERLHTPCIILPVGRDLLIDKLRYPGEDPATYTPRRRPSTDGNRNTIITIRPLGTVHQRTRTGDLVLHINLETGTTNAPVPYVALSVNGEVDGVVLDLGVRREKVAAENLPTDADLLARTEPVPELITEYRERLTRIALSLGGLGLAAPDGVPITFTIDELEFLRHCLELAQRRMRGDIEAATTLAASPRDLRPTPPGHLDITPTPDGYRHLARIFGSELARAEQLSRRLADLSHAAEDGGGEERRDE